MLSSIKNDTDHQAVLTKIQERLPTLPSNLDEVTLEQANSSLRDARHKVKALKKKAGEARKRFLTELAMSKKGEGNRDVAAIVEQIKHSERRREGYSKLRRMLKSSSLTQGGLTSIKVPNETGDHSLVTDAQKIENILI